MFCPICNGLRTVQENCSVCGEEVADCGRVADWVGPYSPYEPALEAGSSMRSATDDSEQICRHLFCCKVCGEYHEVAIALWRL